MSEDICGEEKADGEPCTFEPKHEDGKCGHHTNTKEYEGGRPTKLSYERQERIASAIEQGKSLQSAARMAGVGATAVYEWINRGEAAMENGEDNEYTEFANRLMRARGIGEDFYFRLALDLAKENGDHRFIASLMKQRYPDSWAEKEEGGPGVDTGAGTVINIPESVTEKWQRQG